MPTIRDVARKAGVAASGDEIGMEGANDPDCRRCMIWDEAEPERAMLGLYRRLGRMRRALPWLNTGGGWTTLTADPAANAAPAGMPIAHGPGQAIWDIRNLSGRARSMRLPLPPGEGPRPGRPAPFILDCTRSSCRRLHLQHPFCYLYG